MGQIQVQYMFKREENKNLCEDVLHEIAERQNIKITELCVMPDHIHTVVGIPPTMSVSKVLQFLKGISSGELFKKITFLMQIPQRTFLVSRKILPQRRRCSYGYCTPLR